MSNTVKKTILFITTILTAISVSTGYGSTDSLKGSVNVETFLDWFTNATRYVYIKGLVVLDLIPILFLIVQVVLFFKNGKKLKSLFAGFALLANLVGVFIVLQYAYPIGSQISGWTLDTVPSDWIILKDEWLKYVGLSGLVGMLGWLCFVITYFVSEKKNPEEARLSGLWNFSKNALLFLLIFILTPGAGRLYEFPFFPISYKISGITFIEMHRPLDIAIRAVGPTLFTVILSMHVILALLFFIEKSKNKGWLILAASIFLLGDTLIALQFNGPINDLFLSWTPSTIPSNWTIIRDEWLRYHFYRDIFIFGEVTLILLTFLVKNPIAKMQTAAATV